MVDTDTEVLTTRSTKQIKTQIRIVHTKIHKTTQCGKDKLTETVEQDINLGELLIEIMSTTLNTTISRKLYAIFVLRKDIIHHASVVMELLFPVTLVTDSVTRKNTVTR